MERRDISLCLNVHRVGEIEKILVENGGNSNRPNYKLPEKPNYFSDAALGMLQVRLLYAAPITSGLFARVFVPTKPLTNSDLDLGNSKLAWVYWHDLTFASKSESWRFNLGLQQAWKSHLGI